MITFEVYMEAEPQGSMRSRIIGTTVVTTSANKKLKPFRHTMTQVAMMEMNRLGLELPMAGKHVPVEVMLEFMFPRPKGAPKGRLFPSVKPDADKLVRAIFDALTNVLWADDAQVVRITAEKVYGPIHKVHVSARIIKEKK